MHAIDTRRSRWKCWVWWISTGVLMGLLTWIPAWYWNIHSGNENIMHTWWRVRVMPFAVFDSNVYFQWFNLLLNRIPDGSHFSWLGQPIAQAWRIAKFGLTNMEFLLTVRWITSCLALWIGAWSMRTWSHMTSWQARGLAIAYWVSTSLVFGLRPGVYSWFMPFWTLGTILAWMTYARLEKQDWVRATLLSVGALFFTSIYPWFFLFTFLWISVLWTIALVPLIGYKKFSWMIGTLSLVTVGTAFAFTPLSLAPSHRALWDSYERMGITFGHLPFISNSFFVLLGFVGLFTILQLRMRLELEDGDSTKRDAETIIYCTWIAWIVLLLTWLHSLFTGLSTQNDHFRYPVLWLSWMSLASIIALPVLEKSRVKSSKLLDLSFTALVILSTLGFLRYFCEPLVYHPWHFDDQNILQVSHWFALMMCAWLLHTRVSPYTSSKKIILSILFFQIVLGSVWLLAMLRQNTPLATRLATITETITMLERLVPSNDTICVDPAHVNLLAAFTGRRLYPSEALVPRLETTSHRLNDFHTFVGSYDMKQAGDGQTFSFFSTAYRDMNCERFNFYKPLLKQLHWTNEDIDTFIGCPRRQIDHDWSQLSNAIIRRSPSAAAFTRLCPWVLITPDQIPFWQLPPRYQIAWTSKTATLWHAILP